MQELVKFRSGMHGLNDEVEIEKDNRNVLCLVLSVGASCMCCGSVWLIVVVELVLW